MEDSRPAPLSIDLNEIPSSPAEPSPQPLPPPPPAPAPPDYGPRDAYALACRFHGRRDTPPGPPAEFPGEPGVGAELLPCGLCGRPETRGGTVVCDCCDRGFHLSCLGLRQRQLTADWSCTECERSGAPKIRWSLGPVRLPDINAPPPPSDGDDEVIQLTEGSYNRLMKSDGPFSHSSKQLPYPIMGHLRNSLGGERESDRMIRHIETSSDDILHRGINISNAFRDPLIGSSQRGNCMGTTARLPDQFQGEIFLQALRSFIMERGGILSEGWHVEFEEYPNISDPSVVFCSPDGKKFESMFDVAHYLGIKLCFSSVEERGDGSALIQNSLPQHRRKKDLTRISRTNSGARSLENVVTTYNRELPLHIEVVEPHNNVMCGSKIKGSSLEESGGCESQNSIVELPVQYEDFFIICLGKIDLRMTYHDVSQIWPVGFKSCWHDRITGSFFECEVSDGGNSGPVFKVRRSPCSLFPIPDGATVLIHNNPNRAYMTENVESGSMFIDACYDKDDDILMLLSDPSLYFAETLYIEPSSESSGTRDEIGEFFIEGRSSASVWKMMSETLINSCHEMYKQSGSLRFSCKHNYPCLDYGAKAPDSLGSLARFCPGFGPINTPHLICNVKELENTCISLAKWLNQDRFGLNIDFVQEIIENIPGSRACSQYQLLKDRIDFSRSWTVGSGLLLAVKKNGEVGSEEVAPYGLYRGKKRSRLQEDVEVVPSVERSPPPGRPLSTKLPAELVGDVLQIWEFLCRFYEILGLQEPVSFEELEEELINPWPCDLNLLEKSEKVVQYKDPSSRTDRPNGPALQSYSENSSTIDEDSTFTFIPNETRAAKEAAQAKLASRTYGRCTGVALMRVQSSLLKVLINELLHKCAVFADPNCDVKESKSKHGKKKDSDNYHYWKEMKMDILTVNELTWPELARRYILAVSYINGRVDSTEVYSREGMKLFRCLHGDGGMLCGALAGVTGMEADAMLLAVAERQISGSLKWENEIVSMDQKDSDIVGSNEPASKDGCSIPEWARLLEPVRKLPTNVGTRIRKCIYDALAKNPPEWAKKRLEHSISKEVYKGNASGPTKKAVLSVLAEVCGGNLQRKPEKVQREKKPASVQDIINKKCRMVLRDAISGEEAKVFCNLLGTDLLNLNDNKDEGILGSPAMVSRPLDFRTIDLRLAAGAYGASHEAFHEDVREVWDDICMAFRDRPDLVQLAETSSQHFEELYEKEVLNLVQMLKEQPNTEGLDAETKKKLGDILLGTNDIPKAPWEDGVCKVCGIDKDDDSVLLCDTCDSEYHTYCLSPPLARIPEGDWYCPSCVTGKHKMHDMNQVIKPNLRRNLGQESRAFQEALNQLATSMEEREYWDFTAEERIFLLKFLCDEVLSTALVREHLEQCNERSNDMHQRLRSLTAEWRNLKLKEELLAMKTGKESDSSEVGDGILEERASSMNHVLLMGQQQNLSNPVSCAAIFSEHPLQRALSDAKVVDSGTNSNNGHVLQNASVPSNVSSAINPNKAAATEQEQSVVSSQKAVVDAMGQEVCDVDQRSAHGKLDTTRVVNMEMNFSLPSSVDNLHDSKTRSQEGTHSLSIAVPPSMQDTSQKNRQILHAAGTESEVSTLEANSLKNEILQVQDSIKNLESQLMTTSLRREFMGRDSFGRLYWVTGRPGKRPWLVVDGSVPVPSEKRKQKEAFSNNSGDLASKRPALSRNICPSESEAFSPCNGDLSYSMCFSSSWVVYDSDYQVQILLNWLRDGDPRERELRDCILLWQRAGFHRGSNHVSTDSQLASESSFSEKFVVNCLTTKAAMVLVEKYGPCLESGVGENSKKRGRKGKVCHEERMYRCDCLEPVWPSRHHCISCHRTFSTINELEGHSDGKCVPTNSVSDEGKENDDPLKGKGARSESLKGKDLFDQPETFETTKDGKSDISSKVVNFQGKSSPFDIGEISRKFIPTTSIKELVQEIGLIGCNGVPPFIPNSSAVILDTSLVLHQSKIYDTDLNTGLTSSKEQVPLIMQKAKIGQNVSSDDVIHVLGNATPLQNCIVNGIDEVFPETLAPALYPKSAGEVAASVTHRKSEFMVNDCCNIVELSQRCMIPESSLRPLLGKNAQILKRLKVNLLDMDAALPEEAVRTSKVHFLRRCAWRAFLKSAESIFEVVQATILFEGMIKTEFLKNSWWFWSSLSVAARTPTISSLALRIYTLDDCIIYQKMPQQPCLEPSESSKPAVKTGKKKKDTKDMDVGS